MIYFKKCDFINQSKATHNKILHEAAYNLLAKALKSKGISERNLEFEYNKYGKPSLKGFDDLHFNISHSKGLAVCTVAETPIGIDVEIIRKYPFRVLNRCFTENEISFVTEHKNPDLAFFQLWTLKESYVKTIGIGVSYPMNKAEFLINNNIIISNTEKNYSFLQIIIDNEYVCSVCCDNKFNDRIYHQSFCKSIDSKLLK